MNDFNLRKYLANNPLLKEGYDTKFVDDFISTIFSGYDEEEVETRVHRDEWMDMNEDNDNEGDFDQIYDLVEKGIIEDPHWEMTFTIGEEYGDKYIDVSNTKYLDKHGRSPANYQEGKKPLKEEIEVDIDLMMGADAKHIGSGKWPFSKFLPQFTKYWRERGYSGSDSDFIKQGLENHVDSGLLTDEEVDEAMDYFWDN